MERGNPSAAVGLLRQILKQSPNDVRAQNLMGLALTASGKLQQANGHFNKAIKLNPKFYPALKNLAINELQLKQVANAEAHLQQALKISPEDPAANLMLAELYFQKHEFAPAVDHYLGSRAVSPDPSDRSEFRAKLFRIQASFQSGGSPGTAGI